MIKISVILTNAKSKRLEEITITKEELLQLACSNAREKYPEGTWYRIYPQDGRITINIKGE